MLAAMIRAAISKNIVSNSPPDRKNFEPTRHAGPLRIDLSADKPTIWVITEGRQSAVFGESLAPHHNRCVGSPIRIDDVVYTVSSNRRPRSSAT